ncbi:Dyp-type peroxidase [Corynebacterium lowii]|uniref:Putative deferrochelatase/peroxidase EfeN n=1 Tax=Corynebacterium lowii TaxID=1544413 RepID=A0A0Q0YIJ1_9CORY|nr:Dyp-type peroxidase [Corynebacterium lowii]KQB86508.1 putative deferrochelatase/peroxidase EfeN precursor [Corynebacterium lowii]MDP9851188.1 dye decolorizing peroxidase [Corynebacterium lowii]
MTSLSRRGFLSGLSLSAGGFALAGCAQGAEEAGASIVDPATSTVDFDGPHQAGIATPEQAHLNLVAFSVQEGTDKQALKRLLRLWTEDARELCAGRTPRGSLEPELTSRPANLTITCGFGPRFFDLAGIAYRRPEWLAPLPSFSQDRLDERWGQSDLVLQICGDDPFTVAHAMRNMVRSGSDYADVAWLQQGFVSANGPSAGQGNNRGETKRNLFGQKDGTINPRGEEELADQVWIDEGEPWQRGGTAMVVRRIQMHMDEWEKLDRSSREVVVGRTLDSGAPLSGGEEHTPADFEARDGYGLPAIDPNSHMARATAPADHPEQKILRRPYNWDIAPEPGAEDRSNSGQIFICFQKNPMVQFTPIQQRLDEADRLNQWITHIGSAVYFIPPGTDAGRGDFWGAELLA